MEKLNNQPRCLKKISLSVLLCALWLTIACQQKTSVKTLKHYSADDISFSYPENWQVTKDNEIEGGRLLYVEGGDHALMTITVLPAASDITLKKYVAMVVSSRAKAVENKLKVGQFNPMELDSAKGSDIRRKIAGQTREGITQSFKLTLLGVEVAHRASFFMLQDARRRILLMTQCPEESQRDADSGFSAVLDSFSID
jgi:hypothetical protein